MCPVTMISYVHMYVSDKCGPQNDEFIYTVLVCVCIAISSGILLLLCVITSLCIDSACCVVDVFVLAVLLTFSPM